MKNVKDNNRYRLTIGIVAIYSIIYFSINIFRTRGLFFPPDEFGYWENAASFLGIDWKGASFGQSYYAKGYSFLLLPICVLFQDPIKMYNAALFVNTILFFLQMLVLNELCIELGLKSDKKSYYWILLAGVFYPAHFVYMNYTMSESLLYVLLTIVFWMLAKYENKRTNRYACLTLLFCILLNITHFRTVGVTIAVVMVLLYMGLMKYKRDTSLNVVLTLTFIVILYIFLLVFMQRDSVYLNDKIIRLRKVFTFPGLLSFFVGMIGKIYYVMVSTFGILFFYMRRLWRKRRESPAEIAIFISFIISIAVSSVFFVNGNGVDYLIYGRYTEIFVPIMVCLGLSELECMEKPSTYYLMGCSLVVAMSSVVVFFYAVINGINMYMNDFIIGTTWMFGQNMPKLNILFAVPTLICVISFWILGLKKLPVAILTAVFVVIGIYMSEICVYSYHDKDRSDVDMFDKVSQMYDRGHEVVFLRSPWSNYIGHLQFYMWDRKIKYIEGLDPEAYETGADDVVVTYPNYEEPDQLLARYDTREETSHFIVYYNK